MALAGIHSWCGRNGWAWGHQRTDIDSSAGEDCQVPLAVEDYWKSDLLALWWIWDHFKTLSSHPVWIQTLIGDMVRAVYRPSDIWPNKQTPPQDWFATVKKRCSLYKPKNSWNQLKPCLGTGFLWQELTSHDEKSQETETGLQVLSV